jgi:hypothetical protein
MIITGVLKKINGLMGQQDPKLLTYRRTNLQQDFRPNNSHHSSQIFARYSS